jgi:hypothetical protein
MVWGGATLDAIARLRREWKAMESRRLDYRKFSKPTLRDLSPGKESFDCFFLCDECGYLCETNPPCPSCHATAWIDLDLWANAEALRALEEDARRHPPKWLRRRVRLTALAAGSVVGLATTGALALADALLLGGLGAVGFTVGATGLATAYTHEFTRRRLTRAIVADRVENPTTRRSNSSRSAIAGSSQTPPWTGELWIIVLRGATSQWNRSVAGIAAIGPAVLTPSHTILNPSKCRDTAATSTSANTRTRSTFKYKQHPRNPRVGA